MRRPNGSSRAYLDLPPRHAPSSRARAVVCKNGLWLAPKPPPLSNRRGRAVCNPNAKPVSIMGSRSSLDAPRVFSIKNRDPVSTRASRVAGISLGASDGTLPNVAVEEPSHGGEEPISVGLKRLTRYRRSSRERALL
eukprot:5750285-Prymnesium_polylepis.1